MSDRSKYYVISFDGGGIRGLFEALLLEDLERYCGGGLLDRVNLFAGTSTGSICAMALAAGIDIEQLVADYEDPKICNGFFTAYRPFERTFQRRLLKWPLKILLRSKLFKFIEHLFFPSYSNRGRQEALRAMLGDWAERPIGDLPRKVLVTAFNLNYEPDWGGGQRVWWPAIFTNLERGGYRQPGAMVFAKPFAEPHTDVTLLDAALCSSSVGMGYESWEFEGHRYADGGYYANNPTAVTLAVLANRGILAEQEVFVLSLGTGFVPSSYPNAEGLPARFPWGVLGWNWPEASATTVKFPLAAALVDASMEKDHMVSQIILRGESHYRRVSIPFEPGKAIPYNACDRFADLRKVADEFMEDDYWSSVRDWVKNDWLDSASAMPR